MEADDDAILAKILVNENEGGVKVGFVSKFCCWLDSKVKKSHWVTQI